MKNGYHLCVLRCLLVTAKEAWPLCLSVIVQEAWPLYVSHSKEVWLLFLLVTVRRHGLCVCQ